MRSAATARLVLLCSLAPCALPAPAAADPLDEHSGTEDWAQPQKARRPTATYNREHRELDEEAEEFEQARRLFDRERVEFGRDRAAPLRALQARKAGKQQAAQDKDERAASPLADPAVDEEIKRLEIPPWFR